MRIGKTFILAFGVIPFITPHITVGQNYIVKYDCEASAEPPEERVVIGIRIDPDARLGDEVKETVPKDASYSQKKERISGNAATSGNTAKSGQLTSGTRVLRMVETVSVNDHYYYQVKVLTGDQAGKILYIEATLLKKDGDPPIFTFLDAYEKVIEKELGVKAGTYLRVRAGKGYKIKGMGVKLMRTTTVLHSIKDASQFTDLSPVVRQNRPGDKMIFTIYRVVEMADTGEELPLEIKTVTITIPIR